MGRRGSIERVREGEIQDVVQQTGVERRSVQVECRGYVINNKNKNTDGGFVSFFGVCYASVCYSERRLVFGHVWAK